MNGQTIETSGAMATLDTGTSLMLVSQTVSDAINGAIPGALKDVKFSTSSSARLLISFVALPPSSVVGFMRPY